LSRGRLLAAGLLAALLGLAPAMAAAQDACRADALPCCRAGGPVPVSRPAFGVQVWPEHLARDGDALDALRRLGPGHVRFAIGPNWRRRPPLRTEMDDAAMDVSVRAGFEARPDTAGSVALLRSLQAAGIRLHLVIWEPPPLPGEGEPTPGAGRRLVPANVPLAARFLVATLLDLSRRGLQPDAVELTNEPDGNWNIAMEPAEYLDLVRAVRREAGRRDLRLPKLYGPGTSTLSALRRYLEDPQGGGKPLLDAIDVLSAHAWDDPAKADRFAELAAVQNDLRALRRKPEIALTEFALARPLPEDRSDRMNVKRRVPGGISDTPLYAALSARDLLRFYALGAGTVLYWEFQDQSWGKASFGLRDVTDRPRPIYAALASVADAMRRTPRLRPGTDPRITLEGEEAAWIANPSPDPLDIVPEPGRGLRPDGTVAAFCEVSGTRVGLRVPPWSLIRVFLVTP